MPAEVIRQELKSLMIRSIFLNLAAYLISIIVIGATLSFAAGLLLGTAVLFVSLLLLRYSVLRMEEDARRYGVTNRRRHQMFYALRLLVFGAAFAAALLLRRYISPVAMPIPMLYPRLIYTGSALFSRRDSRIRGKKR